MGDPNIVRTPKEGTPYFRKVPDGAAGCVDSASLSEPSTLATALAPGSQDTPGPKHPKSKLQGPKAQVEP